MYAEEVTVLFEKLSFAQVYGSAIDKLGKCYMGVSIQERIVELEQSLEDLAGDVLLYALDQITLEQLGDTQLKAIEILKKNPKWSGG